VKSANYVAFEGFVKNGHPTPIAPKSKNFALQKPFLLKTRINLVVSATKIRSRIGNNPWGFKFGVTKLTGSRILAVSAHAQQKIG